MRHPRIWTEPDGTSHFEDVEPDWQLTEYVPGFPSETSPATPARSIHLVRFPPGAFQAWHTSPRRHYTITLFGEVEITVSDGERRRFRPGELYLAHDTTGQGHETRAVGDDGWVAAVVTLAE